MSDRAAANGWVAGIVHHAAYDDLEACLPTIRAQTHPPRAVHVVDTGVDPARLEALRRTNPDVRFEARPNRGYGAGANHILSCVRASGDPSVGFVLILNPDVELDPPFAERLIEALQERPRAALASGKLLRPGRDRIDSAGIRMPRHRRPRDRGSEQPDRGQYDRPSPVFGVSGAAMMIRCAALDDLAVEGEVFDEDFFAYQDDTDLSWRANLLGWEVLYQPCATAVHRRRWRRVERLRIEPRVRRHSFANHYLQLVKNERARDLPGVLPALLLWEVLRLGYALLRDPAILGGYPLAARELPRAWRKRRAIQQIARDRDARIPWRT